MMERLDTYSESAWEDVVWRDPERMSGALCFRGTRVPVHTLTTYLRGGHSLDDFLEGFPSVERKQADQFLHLSTRLAEEATPPTRTEDAGRQA